VQSDLKLCRFIPLFCVNFLLRGQEACVFMECSIYQKLYINSMFKQTKIDVIYIIIIMGIL